MSRILISIKLMQGYKQPPSVKTLAAFLISNGHLAQLAEQPAVIRQMFPQETFDIIRMVTGLSPVLTAIHLTEQAPVRRIVKNKGGYNMHKRFSKGEDDFAKPVKLFGNDGRLKICDKVGSTPTAGI